MWFRTHLCTDKSWHRSWRRHVVGSVDSRRPLGGSLIRVESVVIVSDDPQVDSYTGTRWGVVSLTGVVITGALLLNPCSHRQTLGNNGPGDGWARGLCPLNRPINLDETLAAPSQIPPLPFILSYAATTPPNTHILRWKSLVIIVAAGSSLRVLQNGEIFRLWDVGMIQRTLLARSKGWRFISPQVQIKHTCVHIRARICRKSLHACAVVGFRRSSCSCLPAAASLLWGRRFGRGLGLTGGLKAWLRSLFLSH